MLSYCIEQFFYNVGIYRFVLIIILKAEFAVGVLHLAENEYLINLVFLKVHSICSFRRSETTKYFALGLIISNCEPAVETSSSMVLSRYVLHSMATAGISSFSFCSFVLPLHLNFASMLTPMMKSWSFFSILKLGSVIMLFLFSALLWPKN